MEYAKLGHSGLTVSRIALGCMSYGSKKWRDWVIDDPAEVNRHFALALEAGINFFDTANAYSLGVSEELTGRCLAELAAREDIVVASKVYMPMSQTPNQSGLGRKHILESCEASLRRLKMDFIDLYQIHRFDMTTPIEETLDALDSLVRAGKVRYLGASSMAAWQLAKALFTADIHHYQRFVSMQNHYNLAYREEEREVIPLCIDQGLGVLPWSPIARGLLAGNRKRSGEAVTRRAEVDSVARNLYKVEADYDVAEACERVAARRGIAPAQVACAWLLQAPGVIAPVVGATRIEHLRELIESVNVVLTPGEVTELETPYQPHPILGHTQPAPADLAGARRRM
jgi:aryl-alcohol dehydrogenase (NADP+)